MGGLIGRDSRWGGSRKDVVKKNESRDSKETYKKMK